MRHAKTSLAVLVGLATLVVGPVVEAAPGEDDQKKAEKQWDDAEKKQGKGGQVPGPGGGGPAGPGGMMGEENPLKKILELMEQVEGRLFDSDTGDFTQAEQKKIVEAMKFEDKTHQALEELIKKIEEQMQQQQQSSSSSGGQQQQKQQQQQNPNETEQQRQERERQEREKQEREKQEEERRRQQQQQQSPQDQQQKNQQDQQQRGQQDRREGRPPEPPRDEAGQERSAAGRWGMLPAKLHQDAANSETPEPPGRWAELIERYRRRLAETGDR